MATLDSLDDMLIKKPKILHFSGHGMPNTSEGIGKNDYARLKEEGDVLVFENNKGRDWLLT